MKKDCHKYAECLSYILREIKCSNGCDGATVAQLKKLGLELPNATQINVYEMPEMNGLSVVYPEYINAVFCADLHYPYELKVLNKKITLSYGFMVSLSCNT